MRPAPLVFGLLFSICAVTALVGAAPTMIFGHDAFFLLENGWRAVCGQRPHLDFYSPWGPVAFLVVGAGLRIAAFSVNGIGYGNALFGLVVGVWAYWLGRTRLARLPRILLPVYLALLVCAPYPLGFWPMLSSHAMVYNRYGYALLALVIVECAQHSRSMRGESWGGVSSGAAVAILLFLKASFFVICPPFIVFSFLFRRATLVRVGALAAGFVATAFCFLAYLRFDIGAIIGDLRMAAAARSSLLSWKSPIYVIEAQWAPLLLVLALIAACSFLPSDRNWTRRLELVCLGLMVYLADIGLVMTNAQGAALPLLPVLGLLVASRVLDIKGGLPAELSRAQIPYHASLFLFCLLLFLPQLSSDAIGLGAAALRKVRPSEEKSPVRFGQPVLASLLLYNDDRALQKSANGSVYTAYVNDGVALLRKYCTSQDRVLDLDMQNPFPYALGWRPARGGIASVSINYTFDATHRPSWDAYFGDATIVMKPKHPAQTPEFIDGFYPLVMPELLDRYRLIAETDQWLLYRRK